MKTTRKRLSRVERLELAQRHFEGSTVSSLQRRFRVNEKDIKTVIRQFQSGSFFSKKNWPPHFYDKEVVRHPVGKDAFRALRAGNGDDPFLSILDPNLDIGNGIYHLRWSKQDIDDLLYGIVTRSFSILKEGRPSSEEYQEEVEFISSNLFSAICSHLGLDGDDLKSTFDYKLRRHANPDQHINAVQ